MPQYERIMNEGTTMEIRPEAETIVSMLPGSNRVFVVGPTGQVAEIAQALSEAGLEAWADYPATALTNAVAAAIEQPSPPGSGIMQSCLRYLEDIQPGSMAIAWKKPFLDAVRAATEACFSEAEGDFHRDDLRSATAHLNQAVNCAIIGQAATRGWPHATPHDDLNAIVGLMAGTLPHNETEFKTLHGNIPQQDLTLSSLYGAVKHINRAVEMGFFHAAGYTADMATDYARQTVALISEVGDGSA